MVMSAAMSNAERAGRTITNPYIVDGMERIRTRYPQTHFEKNRTGSHVVFVPSVKLPDQYRENICTVLFVVPPGFPATCPDHFFTDIEVRCKDGKMPHNTNIGNGEYLAQLGFPQWRHCQWWSWHLQLWNPNQSSLYTYMRVIEERLSYPERFHR
jgi:Prokaryotic E2 family E